MKKFLLPLFLLIATNVWATSYYINSSTGSNSNPGTLASPFQYPSAIQGVNSLNPGDNAYFAKGTTYTGSNCTLTINSSGQINNSITIGNYGSGALPIFTCAQNITTVAGWTGWTNTTGNVWESQTPIPFTVQGVIVDGTYNLLARYSYMATHLDNLYYQSGGYLYVNLIGGGNPGSHTIEVVGAYDNTTPNTGGLTTNGNYLKFTGLEFYGDSNSGALIKNRYITLTSSTITFSGYASVYLATHDQTPGAYNDTITNNTLTYANGNNTPSGGNGEGITNEGSYNEIAYNTVSEAGMAGIDDLCYATDTPGQYVTIHDNTISSNSVRSLQNWDNGGYDPPGVYLDGCSYVWIYNNNLSGNSNSAYTLANQNATSLIQLSTEHQANLPHDVYVFNNNFQESTYFSLQTTLLNGITGTPWYNVWVFNNSFVNSYFNGGSLIRFTKFNTSLGQTLHLYNNIFYQGSGAVDITFDSYAMVDANYNSFYSQGTKFIDVSGTDYTLSGWQSLSSQDANSITGDPYLVSYTVPYDFHLQRVASGQSNTSALIGAGLGSYASQFINLSSNGTTNSTGAIDAAMTDIGYHYSLTTSSIINWPTGQIGSGFNSN